MFVVFYVLLAFSYFKCLVCVWPVFDILRPLSLQQQQKQTNVENYIVETEFCWFIAAARENARLFDKFPAALTRSIPQTTSVIQIGWLNKIIKMEIIYRERSHTPYTYLHSYKIQILMQINVNIHCTVHYTHLINGLLLIEMKSSISLKCGYIFTANCVMLIVWWNPFRHKCLQNISILLYYLLAASSFMCN